MADTRRGHEKPGTEKLTVNMDPELKTQAKIYAITNGWSDLTAFLHAALRHSMKAKIKKGGTR